MLTSADFRASLNIISSPPNKPPPKPLLVVVVVVVVFLLDSASDASDSSLPESSPSFITTGSCLGGVANDTCEGTMR